MANNEPLPAELEARILKFKELKLPYAPLLKFWDNLKQNPSFNSRNDAVSISRAQWTPAHD